jgi:hypothetical protein
MKTEDLHVETICQGDGGQRQGFGESVDATRRRYGRSLLLAAMLAGTAGAAGWVLLNFSTPPPPADAVDRLERIRLGMGLEEVSDIMNGPGIVQSRNVAFICPDRVFSYETYEVGNGWAVDMSFEGCKLAKRSPFYRCEPPWYRRAWQSLQHVIPSVPDMPF